MHAAIQRHPARYAGFAVLPMSQPSQAATELRRCITDLGFEGALIDNHVNGAHYEGKSHRIFWESVQELDVPVYLHPTWPAAGVQKPQYSGDISTGASGSLGSSGWGWHSDVGAHVLKLFASGLFDEFPRLKVIVGHMGEMLPFMLERIEYLSKRWGVADFASKHDPPLTHRPFGEVYRENIYITTSGCWSINPMACILRNTPIEHILYSVDYPFAKNEDGYQFMEELEKSGLVTKEQLEQIGYKNAEKLLGLSVSKGGDS
jgi:predicted TIM-barrel fold metal-dependent hydrolase